MPLSNYSLNKYVAQELADLKQPGAQSVLKEFPNRENWISTFVLKSIFHLNLPEQRAALALALIRRAQVALEDYDEACTALGQAAMRDGTIRNYFYALRKLESTIAMMYQAYDFARKALSIKLFKSRDGTPYQRLNFIYNRSRHPDVTKLPSGHLHPVWIKDGGVYTEGENLKFEEIENLLGELGRIAERTSNGNV